MSELRAAMFSYEQALRGTTSGSELESFRVWPGDQGPDLLHGSGRVFNMLSAMMLWTALASPRAWAPAWTLNRSKYVWTFALGGTSPLHMVQAYAGTGNTHLAMRELA